MDERKVCVVTGASSGIGAAIVRRYAREGWQVVLNHSKSAPAAEAVAGECRAFGVQALVLQGNVALDADCLRLAAEVQRAFGRCDVLVNNAGTTKFVAPRDLHGLQAEDFHRIVDVNVIGAFQMARAFLPLLQLRGGAVINMSSVASLTGAGSSIAYAASKGALNALTLALARALGPAVRVNAIAPGFVETPWLQQGLGAERYEQSRRAYQARAVLDAVVGADDVADAAWWLGAGAAKTTGEIIAVDAGARMLRV